MYTDIVFWHCSLALLSLKFPGIAPLGYVGAARKPCLFVVSFSKVKKGLNHNITIAMFRFYKSHINELLANFVSLLKEKTDVEKPIASTSRPRESFHNECWVAVSSAV